MDLRGQRSREQESREKMLSLPKWCFLKKSAKSYKEAKGKTLSASLEPKEGKNESTESYAS